MDYQAELMCQLDPAQLLWEVGTAGGIPGFKAADPWQDVLLRSQARRVLVLCARQAGKSTAAAVLVLHQALYDPGLILIASRTAAQAEEVLKKVLEFYRLLDAPVPATRVLTSALELENGARVLALCGEGDNLRGYSAPKLIVVDEAARTAGDVFTATLPMLSRSNGRIVILSTPAGSVGFFAAQWHRQDVSWERILARASECPGSFNPEYLEAQRKILGDRNFEEEFQCAFVGQGSPVFRKVRESVDAGRVGPVELVDDPKLAFQLGIDLGRLNDATVLTILDSNGRQVYWSRFLEVSYPRQIQAIRAAFTVLEDHARSHGITTKLQSVHATMDVTGVGLPIYESLADLYPIHPFTFTAGSKLSLIDELGADLDNGRLRLFDIEQQTLELTLYQQERTPAGNYKFGAPSGQFDDCIIALGLAAHGIRSVDFVGCY
jgi:hypothetical protein